MKGSMTASFTVLFVLGGGACAALAAAIMAAAVTADESTSVAMGAFCLLFPGGSGACAVPPSGTGYGNDQHMIQTGFLGATNLTGGAAAAAAPGSPHSDMYMYSDLLHGSGGEKINGIPPFLAALGRALAQPFSFLGISIRCDSALRTSGGGGGVGAAALLLLPSHDSCSMYGCRHAVRLIPVLTCAAASKLGVGAPSQPPITS